MGQRTEQQQLAKALRVAGRTWPEVASELRSRWPGLTVLAATRIAHGWSQAEAARAWTKLWPEELKTHKDISAYENRRPSNKVLRRLARLYECAVIDLMDDDDYRDLDSNQRNARPSAQPASAGSDSPASDVAAIRAMLGALTVSDRQFGGGEAKTQATEYLNTVVLPRLDATAHQQPTGDMFAVATEFALRVASMQLDSGQAGMSRQMLGLAGSLAQQADDVTLNAWVLARRGEQYIYEKKPREAVVYMSASVALAESAPSAVRSFLLGKQALALSLAHDKAGAERSLGHARTAVVDAADSEAPAWMGNYGWGHLRHDEALCYAHLGMGAKAIAAAEESIQVRERARFARPYAFSLGVQAIGYSLVGEIETACAVGHELVSLAARLDSERVKSRLIDVLRALEAHRALRPAHELHEAAQPVLAGASC